jgi:TRAP-type C4-dicarboxylate transport system permease small subunit
MARFERMVTRALEVWAGFLLVLMVVVVTAGVFYRYVLNAALSWYDEFASYLLVWLTFYGAVLATQRDVSIEFDEVVRRLAPGTRRVVEAASGILTLAFHLMLLVYGIVLMRSMGAETAISLPGVKMAWVYSVLPISGALMLAFSAVQVVRRWRGRRAASGAIETEVG